MTYIAFIIICFFLNGYALIKEQIMPEKDNVKQSDKKYTDAEEEVVKL